MYCVELVISSSSSLILTLKWAVQAGKVLLHVTLYIIITFMSENDFIRYFYKSCSIQLLCEAKQKQNDI